jgi:hypothetical protein
MNIHMIPLNSLVPSSANVVDVAHQRRVALALHAGEHGPGPNGEAMSLTDSLPNHATGSRRLVVTALESRKSEVEQWLLETRKPVETDPTGAENGPHTTTL